MSLDVGIYYEKTRTGICARNEYDAMIEVAQDELRNAFPGLAQDELRDIFTSLASIWQDLARILQDLNNYNYNFLYEDNITHNLTRMAKAAGIYKYIWRPEENNIKYAGDLIEYLEEGYCKLINNPDFYREFEPANNWGSFEGLLNFVMGYLGACKKHPLAKIYASG